MLLLPVIDYYAKGKTMTIVLKKQKQQFRIQARIAKRNGSVGHNKIAAECEA
jgi:hypothetical protein